MLLFLLGFIEQSKSGLYEPLLQENEREAIAELLQYLESMRRGTHEWLNTHSFLFLTVDRSNTNFFEGEPLRPLSTLAYSDNVDLQRSAALAFAEITEKGKRMNELHDPPLN